MLITLAAWVSALQGLLTEREIARQQAHDVRAGASGGGALAGNGKVAPAVKAKGKETVEKKPPAEA